MKKRYANIMSDTAFKLVFGTKANEDLLVALLNRRRRDLSYLEQLDRQAELGYARDSGIEEGLEQGLRQGREEGREEGRLQSLRETAQRMLAQGLSPEMITEVTGLDPETLGIMGMSD